MCRDLLKQFLRRIVEQEDLSFRSRVACPVLLQHLDHHVVSGLVQERDHDILSIHLEGAVLVLLHRSLGNLPDVVPCQHIRHFISQFLHISLIDITCLCRPHKRHRIQVSIDPSFFEELWDHLILFRPVKLQLRASQPVLVVTDQVIQGDYHILTGLIGRNVVRIRDAYIRGRPRGNVCDDIIVDVPVIRIQAKIHLDLWIQFLKTCHCLVVDLHLRLVGVILGPEGDLMRGIFVKCIRHRK